MSRTLYEYIRHRMADSLRRGLWTMGQPISGPFQRLEENCWFVECGTPPLNRRNLVLAEEGTRLIGAESYLGVIKRLGYGAYRFHDDGIYFSSSDNSDPNQNGRQYRLVWNPRNVFANYVAVNRRSGKMTESQLEDRVGYAISVIPIVKEYEKVSGTTLNGKNVLELGPGADYGWTMVLACLGAHCSVADPFTRVWSDDFHLPFFSALAKRLQCLPEVVTIAPIQRLLQERDFKRAEITCFDDAAEELQAPNETFDFVLSAAVGEHFYDIEAAFRQLARVTRPGGIGLHWIDLRDHRDFSRPLEYLLMNDADFLKEFVLRHAECANRHRAHEFEEVFRQVGFELISKVATSLFDPEYLDDLIPRLRMNGHERYRSHVAAELQPALMKFIVRKHELR